MLRTAVAAIALLVVAAACGGTSTRRQPPAAPGFDPASRTIHVGALLTAPAGPDADVASAIDAGARTWFAALNAEKHGVGGRYRVVVDSDSGPDVVQAYQRLRDRVTLISELVPGAETEKLVPVLQQDGALAATSSHDARWVQDGSVIPLGTPTQVEVTDAAAYAVEALGAKAKTLCALTESSPDGHAVDEGLDYGVPREGLAVRTALHFSGSDVAGALAELQRGGCQLVFLGGSATATSAVLNAAAASAIDFQWIGVADGYTPSLRKGSAGAYLEKHALFVGEGSQWGDRALDGTAALLARKARYAPSQPPDDAFVFGYVQAWAVTDVLDKAVSAGDLSREGLRRALAALGDAHFDELSGVFHYGPPGHRHAPVDATMFRVDRASATGLVSAKYDFATEAAHQYPA